MLRGLGSEEPSKNDDVSHLSGFQREHGSKKCDVKPPCLRGASESKKSVQNESGLNHLLGGLKNGGRVEKQVTLNNPNLGVFNGNTTKKTKRSDLDRFFLLFEGKKRYQKSAGLFFARSAGRVSEGLQQISRVRSGSTRNLTAREDGSGRVGSFFCKFYGADR